MSAWWKTEQGARTNDVPHKPTSLPGNEETEQREFGALEKHIVINL